MRLTQLTALVVLLFSAQFAAAVERKLYVGVDSEEVTLSFHHFVEIEAKRAPSRSKVDEKIELQLQHLFGTMAASKYKSVPRGEHEILLNSVEKKSPGLYIARYSYTGSAVVQSSAGNSLELLLPNNPDQVFEAGMVGSKNPCTDDHYQTEGDFWYFWNPYQVGCPLQLGKDFEKIVASVSRVQNSPTTYPEYERLLDKSNTVKISLLMGMDDPNKLKDPNISPDVNAQNFQEIKRSLIRDGYTSKKADTAAIKSIYPGRSRPYVEDFKKEIQRNGKIITIWVQVFFGPSGMSENSEAFHLFFKDALENSAVMIYDGHSGLGGHLDLSAIEQANELAITPPQDKYQIYFFNSCSSYSYYNTMFFDRKKTDKDPKGTKNLDILTNGLATYFYVMHDTNWALIKAVEFYFSGKSKISYQTLAQQIDSGNLFGINGDEDNPKK
jgi:hypothetical protein